MIGATDSMKEAETMRTHLTSAAVKPTAIVAAIAAAFALTAFTGIGQASAAEPGEDDFLGTAETFVIIATDTVTDADPVAPSEVHGDVALTATNTAAMELTPTQVIDGDIYVAGPTPDPTAMQARADLGVAYGIVAAAVPTEIVGTANLALASAHLVTGLYVYEPGVYNSGSFLLLDGDIVLDGLSDLDSVFIFQAGSALDVRSNSRVTLINGAQACNVYWQVGSSATLGTNADFVGTILAATSISALTGADVDGQLLASALNAGAVTLDDNVIDNHTVCIRTTTTGTTSTGTTTTVTTRNTVGAVSSVTTTTPPVTGGTVVVVPNTGGNTGNSTLANTGNSTLANTGNSTLANTGVALSASTYIALLAALVALGAGTMLVLIARRKSMTGSNNA